MMNISYTWMAEHVDGAGETIRTDYADKLTNAFVSMRPTRGCTRVVIALCELSGTEDDRQQEVGYWYPAGGSGDMDIAAVPESFVVEARKFGLIKAESAVVEKQVKNT